MDQQCIKCADNFYSYYKDYLNYQKGIYKSFNCFTLDEVKMENENYFLNGNYFKKCDDSCGECENSSNNCLKCQNNYYYIDGSKNGSCFHYPLEKYSVVQIDGETVFLPCFHLCKYCNQVSESFFYQQCYECDEDNYTLDVYSLNKSYCIPKIENKNNTYLIKDEKKWLIEDFEGIENFIIENKLLEIDLQRILNSPKFKNLEYKIVDECPKNKPYIIFTTRQCVSSCFSSNLIEFGIFMTKQLYLYNNICYNECPYGSIKDNITLTCIEQYEYIKPEPFLIKDSYVIVQEDYIKRYLGDDYAKHTVQCIRASDFSTIHYKVSNNTSFLEIVEKLKEKKIPIIIFPECLNILRNVYNLNESENIYIEIIENNDKNSIFNSTSFNYFDENGEFLNLSYCFDLTLNIMKYIDTSKIDLSFLDIINKMKNLSINYSDTDTFLDRCQPLSIDDKDWTIEDRKELINQIQRLCDPGCSFVSFDIFNNYSFCQCKLIEEKPNTIKEEIKSDIKNLEFVERLTQLFEDGNWNYFFCYKSMQSTLVKNNWIMYFGFIFIISEIILFAIYIYSNYSKIINEFLNKIRYYKLKNNSSPVIVIDLSNNNNNDKNELIDDYYEAKEENFSALFCNYLKENFIVCICCNNDNINTIIFKIIKFIIFLENYYFICGFLFTERYISSRKYLKLNEFEYAFTTEKQRICIIIFICSIMNLIIYYFFNFKNNLDRIDNDSQKGMHNNIFKRKVLFLKRVFIIKFIIGIILVILLHIVIIYFMVIFFTIHSHSQSSFIVYLILSIAGYFAFYTIFLLIIVILRCCSLKNRSKSPLFEFSFKLSVLMEDII